MLHHKEENIPLDLRTEASSASEGTGSKVTREDTLTASLSLNSPALLWPRLLPFLFPFLSVLRDLDRAFFFLLGGGSL